MSSTPTPPAAGPATRPRAARAACASAPRARWCRAGSRLKSRRPNRLAAQFRTRLVETDALEARGDPRAQTDGALHGLAHGIAEDLARLFLHAAAMRPGALLQPRLQVIIELPDQDLSHDADAITLSIRRLTIRTRAKRRRTRGTAR